MKSATSNSFSRAAIWRLKADCATRHSSAAHIEKQDYEEFYTRPLSWEQAVVKFERLTAPFTNGAQRAAIVDRVAHLETKEVAQLTEVLRVPFTTPMK